MALFTSTGWLAWVQVTVQFPKTKHEKKFQMESQSVVHALLYRKIIIETLIGQSL